MKRFLGIVVRVGLPLAALMAVIFAGGNLVGVWLGQQGALRDYAGQQPVYQATGAALLGTPEALRGVQYVAAGVMDSVEQFATNTPRPEPAFATNTPEGAPEATPVAPTAASQPATAMPMAEIGPLPTILFLGEPYASQPQPTAMPTAFPIIDRRGANLINVLLMGQDNEVTGDNSMRTDTMIVVSINRDAGTVSMLHLPRDLYVYMPQVGMGRLNTVYEVGTALGWDGGAFFFMRQVILHNLGINVHYYALVDLTGFSTLIDRVGGVELAVDCAIQDYQIFGAEVPSGAVLSDPEALQYTLPVGFYRMTGKEALWYARSRGNSDDFDRGRRQQQLLRAAFRAARDNGLLGDVTQLPGLIQDGLAVVETDMPFETILSLAPLALSVEPSQIETYRLIRTYHTVPWQPPDGQFVQLPVYEPVFDLMTDFYTPPTDNQTALRSATVRVVNATGNASFDRVAAERLGEANFAAIPSGDGAGVEAETYVIDYTGSQKGSSLSEILRVLNLNESRVRVQPESNRTFDYEVVVGADYNACGGAVLPVE
ncbi:MAG: LCP family protein [Anaerolineae bacterium]|jgi:LCP family protein required for cell wall assembly|nr:LCP family protein [Anaerolineae bacterium]